MVDSLPENIHDLALIIPTVSCIEVFREGYYGQSYNWHYSIGYVVIFNLFLTLISLIEIKNMSKRLLVD